MLAPKPNRTTKSKGTPCAVKLGPTLNQREGSLKPPNNAVEQFIDQVFDLRENVMRGVESGDEGAIRALVQVMNETSERLRRVIDTSPKAMAAAQRVAATLTAWPAPHYLPAQHNKRMRMFVIDKLKLGAHVRQQATGIQGRSEQKQIAKQILKRVLEYRAPHWVGEEPEAVRALFAKGWPSGRTLWKIAGQPRFDETYGRAFEHLPTASKKRPKVKPGEPEILSDAETIVLWRRAWNRHSNIKLQARRWDSPTKFKIFKRDMTKLVVAAFVVEFDKIKLDAKVAGAH